MLRLFVAISILLSCILIAWRDRVKSPAAKVKDYVVSELGSLENILEKAVATKDRKAHQQFYHQARLHYKHLEFFLEFYGVNAVKLDINGAPIPKYSTKTPGRMISPAGFQVIEGLLYEEKATHPDSLKKEWSKLHDKIAELHTYFRDFEPDENKLFEMAQLELFRMAALTLCGYDATLTLTNVREASWALEGVEKVIEAYEGYGAKENVKSSVYGLLKKELNRSKIFLLSNTNYESFNRLKFITDYIDPLNKLLCAFRVECNVPWVQQSALNLNSGYLFRKESFNKYFFALTYDDTVHQGLQASLGRLLFFDPVLSGKNNRSCVSCHNPDKGFTDAIPKSRSVDTGVFLSRNAPTLLNVAFQKAFFYDGRALQIEQQAFDVIHNEKEMHSNISEAVNKLKESTEYRKLFRQAFAGTQDTPITPQSVMKSLTEYEKNLVSMNSRFDKYLRGNRKILNSDEIRGFNLFAGKALCGSCHFFPLFNGTVPPFYNDSEFEVIGVPASAENKELDKDLGRYEIIKLEELKHAFKTPTVRNISITGPYMHNGVYNNLEQVIEFYHKGGGAGLGFALPNQTLPFDSLKLSGQEKKNIIAFLKSLTDTVGLTSKPDHLPAFEDNATLNKRKIGGEY